MGVRAVAGTYVVLRLSAACFSLYVLALYPATLHQLQMIKEQVQMDCAATAAEDTEMRADAAVLLLLGAAQVLLSMGILAAPSRLGTFLACFLSPITGLKLLAFLGRCHQLLYVGAIASFGLLCVAGGGLLLTLFDIGVALRGEA